jgi:hypothetical protein
MNFKIIWRKKGTSEIVYIGLGNYKSMEAAEEAARMMSDYRDYYDMSIEARPCTLAS